MDKEELKLRIIMTIASAGDSEYLRDKILIVREFDIQKGIFHTKPEYLVKAFEIMSEINYDPIAYSQKILNQIAEFNKKTSIVERREIVALLHKIMYSTPNYPTQAEHNIFIRIKEELNDE